VLEDQGCVHQVDPRKVQFSMAEVAAIQLQTSQRPESPLYLVKVPLVDVYADDPFRDGWIDVLQTVAARHAEHSDALRTKAIESAPKEVGQRRGLLNGSVPHVAFIVPQGDGEPGIRHEHILRFAVSVRLPRVSIVLPSRDAVLGDERSGRSERAARC
jgi:hypothetical protein